MTYRAALRIGRNVITLVATKITRCRSINYRKSCLSR